MAVGSEMREPYTDTLRSYTRPPAPKSKMAPPYPALLLARSMVLLVMLSLVWLLYPISATARHPPPPSAPPAKVSTATSRSNFTADRVLLTNLMKIAPPELFEELVCVMFMFSMVTVTSVTVLLTREFDEARL